MARKRHLASSARVFLCFCLMAQIEVQEVQGVQAVFAVFILYKDIRVSCFEQDINLIKRAVRRCTLCPCQHQGSNAHSGHALGQNSKGYLCEFL